MEQHLPLTIRRILAGLLAAAGIAYLALLTTTYFQTTAPSSLAPDLGEVRRLLFSAARPPSPMERRLEASNTPLGTGPLISDKSVSVPIRSGASMSFAFGPKSGGVGQSLGAVELAEREGERQALLDWIRTGASQKDYDRDDHSLEKLAIDTPITPALLVREASTSHTRTPARVRIRSLIDERCVTCHQADGDDTARLIPFDKYDSIARYLLPETQVLGGRAWLVAALVSLFPFAALVGPAFACTSHSRALRIWILVTTIISLTTIIVCWFAGPRLAPALLTAAVMAITMVMLQSLAGIVELLGIQRETVLGSTVLSRQALAATRQP